jgi:hypothetical protein
MTTYNKTTLKTFFETNDVPSGTDYANLIDSQVNIVETALQSMAGPLQATEFNAARVSAGNANFTGTLTVIGQFSAKANMSIKSISASAMFVAHNVSAGNVFANSAFSTVDANITGEFIRTVGTYVAAGTAQATATVVSAGISYLTGASDGQSTGYRLMANKTGLTQLIYNQNTVSANLWPCTGGQINVLASNAAFGMAASTLYTIVHIRASGYAVK